MICLKNRGCGQFKFMYVFPINMSEQKPEKKNVDLSALDFGPAWARGSDSDQKQYKYKEESKGPRGKKGKGPRKGGFGDKRQGGDFKGRPSGGNKNFKRGRAPQKFEPS